MILLLHFRFKICRSHGASLSLINKRPTFLRTNPWWRTSLTLAQGVVTLSRVATFCLKISMINLSQILVYIRGSNLESTNTELFPSLVTNYNCSFWFWMANYCSTFTIPGVMSISMLKIETNVVLYCSGSQSAMLICINEAPM